MIGNVVKSSTHNWDKYAKQKDLERRKEARRQKSKEREYGERVEMGGVGKGSGVVREEMGHNGKEEEEEVERVDLN